MQLFRIIMTLLIVIIFFTIFYTMCRKPPKVTYIDTSPPIGTSFQMLGGYHQ